MPGVKRAPRKSVTTRVFPAADVSEIYRWMRGEGAGAARPITCRYGSGPEGAHVEVWLPGGDQVQPEAQVAYANHPGIVAGDSAELRALLLWMAGRKLRSAGVARHVYHWKDGAWTTELQVPCAKLVSSSLAGKRRSARPVQRRAARRIKRR